MFIIIFHSYFALQNQIVIGFSFCYSKVIRMTLGQSVGSADFNVRNYSDNSCVHEEV